MSVSEVQDEQAEDQGEDQSAMTVEERAIQMGWKPPDEFRGPEGKFTSAEEFVQRGEEELPLLRSNLRRMGQQIKDLEAGQKSREEYFDLQIKAQENVHKREMRDAVDTGDTVAYDAASKALEDLPTAPTAPESPGPEEYDRAFMEQNAWYGVDHEKTQQARGESARLNVVEPGLPMDEHLRKVAAAVNGPARPQGGVESRPRRAPAKAGKKDFASMPQDAKDMAARIMKSQGSAVHDKTKFEADFAKTWHASQE